MKTMKKFRHLAALTVLALTTLGVSACGGGGGVPSGQVGTYAWQGQCNGVQFSYQWTRNSAGETPVVNRVTVRPDQAGSAAIIVYNGFGGQEILPMSWGRQQLPINAPNLYAPSQWVSTYWQGYDTPTGAFRIVASQQTCNLP